MSKGNFLKEITAKKQERILFSKQALPEQDLKARLAGLAATRPFLPAINRPKFISLIAEIKKASPSAGLLREEFDPLLIAQAYEASGAQAISVVTEEDYFQGSLDYLVRVKEKVALPVLRKDFILQPYQLYESRLYGADAVLLIAELLTRESLMEFIGIAEALNLGYIVEAHSEKELKKVLNLKKVPPVIGINNRDLNSLEVEPRTVERLYLHIPKGKVVVVESGIKSAQDVLFLKILGVNAVLIGEAFMRAPEPSRKVEEIMGW
jgi:indole-3-glycerol phosphate synthase